jgi:cellulose synthase/poly-beta-1,6-N-acetylglucosamine synthase-like glycosyltransferase
MNNLHILLPLLGAAYALFALILFYGWRQLPVFKTNRTAFRTPISIVLAARNEEHTIAACLDALLAQDYPRDLFEIIVINDHSEDATADRVNQRIRSTSHRLQLLKLDEGTGKKKALAKGIGAASGELIVTTDADSLAGPLWLKTIATYYETHQPDLILGPVQLAPASSLFQRIQALEFTGIVGCGAALCGLGMPIYGNGANIAYRKASYLKANGFSSHEHIASGDDMLLMQDIAKQNGKISFLRSADAIVNTCPSKDFKSFWNQRLRWAGKNFRMISPFTLSIAMLVTFSNIAVLTSPFLFILEPSMQGAVLSFLALRMFSDLLLLSSFSRLMKNNGLLFLFLPALFFTATYSVLVAMASPFIRPQWKNRTIN